MNRKIVLRRHPIAAALLLVAMLAGCNRDDASMYAQNAPAAGRPYPQQIAERSPAGGGYAGGNSAAYAGGNSAGYAAGNSAGYAGGNGGGSGGGYKSGDPEARFDRNIPFSGRPDRDGPSGAMNAGNGGAGNLDELMNWERQDAGVPPTRELHSGAMHGPTPSQIPGGQVITTKGLVPLLQQGVPVYVFDVLGVAQTLPNAIPAEFAAQPGSFDDQTQEQLAKMLEQVTRGNTSAPLVFYCQGPQCWMSYNAALRTIALGYRNVLWYRGGMEAWNNAGLRFAARRG